MVGPLLKREIESTFTVVRAKSTPEELVFLCPECGDRSGHRSVNLRTGRTFCWRCNKGRNNKGHFMSWAAALGYRFQNTESAMAVPVEELLTSRDAHQPAVPLISPVKLPEGFTTIDDEPESAYTRLITRMARRKRLYYEDFVWAGVGFTRTDPVWEPFAIFPVREYGITVYYQGRTYVDVPGESTKRFPGRNQVRYGAGQWVYNIDTARQQRPEVLVLVESILNVLSLRRKFAELGWNNVVPVCVFKHHISRVQFLKITQCPGLKEVCLLFDHDAIDKTWRSVADLTSRVRVTVADMPMVDGNQKCDPNDDAGLAAQAIEDRSLYTAGSAQAQILKSAAPKHDITGIKIRS